MDEDALGEIAEPASSARPGSVRVRHAHDDATPWDDGGTTVLGTPVPAITGLPLQILGLVSISRFILTARFRSLEAATRRCRAEGLDRGPSG